MPPAMPPAALSLTLYASDMERLARFYEQVFGLARGPQEAGFVLLHGGAFELVIVQAPPHLAEAIATPPVVREGTPIKASFLVRDIEALREVFERQGGRLGSAEAGWRWRGCRHLDGVDPEGNVVQVREDDASG